MLATNTEIKALVDLFHHGTRLTYKKGELIIRPGEKPSAVFFIEEGLVKAYDITKYGEENLLIIRREEEVFPILRTFTGEGPTIIYEAMCPVTVWRLSSRYYLEAIEHNPHLLRSILDMVVEMYRLHSERIINLEYRSVRERLISFLLTMAKRFGEEQKNGSVIVNVPLKQQDIASSINASRETTGRELSKLEQKGLIDSNHLKRITLLDIEKLWSYFE